MNLIFNDAFGALVDDPQAAFDAKIEDYWADVWPTVAPIVRLAMAGTSSFFEDLPVRHKVKDGWRHRWWTFSYSPIRLSDGRIGGLFSTATETTRHVELERQLEESEQALRRFTDLVPNLLWQGDAAGRIFYLNRRMLTYTGLAQGQATDWASLVHPDDIASVIAAYAKAQAQQVDFECQHRLRGADGSYRWFFARAQPIFDEDSELTGWYGCATDIQNWRLAVDELRKSETLVRRFAENAARILWIADLRTGRVEYLNAEGRRYWDGEPGREINSWDDWLLLIHPSHQSLVADAIDRLRAGETVGGVYRVAGRSGRYAHLRTTLFPIMDERGQFEKFGGIAENVESPRRRLIYLVDADRESQRGLATRLWSKGCEVRSFTNVQAFMKVAPALKAGCVVVHLSADTNWTDRIVAAAAQESERLRVVVLSEHDQDADHVRDIMKKGAADVLPFDADIDSLEAAIDEAMRPLEAAGPDEVAAGQARHGDKLAILSLREREILARLTGGATNKLVALDLGISPRTVEAHRARIFDKLGVSSLAEAVAITVSAS